MAEIDRALRDVQYRDRTNLAARQSLHDRFSTNPESWPRWVFDRLDLPPAGRVLEIGCGTGTLWQRNSERVPAGWGLTLADFSRGMLRDARRALGDLAARCAFEQADAQDLPHAAASFDAVIANHMLYHVPDRRRAIGEIRRVLRPGGRLYATTNGSAHLAEIDDLVARVAPAQPRVNREVAEKFGLETGARLLAEQLADVHVVRFADGLRVTEAEALLAYVGSMALAEPLSKRDRAALRSLVDEEIGRHGSFRVTKEPGLLLASRGN